MNRYDITCLLFSDLYPWERGAVESLLHHLSLKSSVKRIDANYNRLPNESELKNTNVIWVLSHNWQKAFGLVRKIRHKKIFLSILNLGNIQKSLPTLFVAKYRQVVPSSVNILVHSKINYRFFQEIEGVSEKQLSHIHLPFPNDSVVRMDRKKEEKDFFRIGALGPLIRESNYNYFMGIAHYVCSRAPGAKFQILGSGRLLKHLSNVRDELGLQGHVEIEKNASGVEVNELDLLLYVPIRNNHFVPVFLAGASGIPVLSSTIPGINEVIEDGKNGFVLPMNEIRPVGELVLRFMKNEELYSNIGNKLNKKICEKYSAESLVDAFGRLFFGKQPVLEGLHQAA